MSRFFFYPFLTNRKERVFLSEEETKHLLANRIKVGEEFTLWNGRGSFCKAYLEAYDRKRARIRTEGPVKKNIGCSLHPKLQLFQALLKSTSRTDWLVEKATEIGISHIYFFPTTHSLKKTVSKSNFKRWRRIALSACKQSGHPFLPTIGFLRDTQKAIRKLESIAGIKLLADPKAQKTLFECLSQPLQRFSKIQNVFLLIGPEGDFSETEKENFVKIDCVPVLLSRTVLRSETAAVFGLSVIKSYFENIYSYEICHQDSGL